MKVLLISPNTLTVPHPVYPLGLDYVKAAIAGRHSVRILDFNVAGPDALEGELRETPPDVVGLSLRNIDNLDASDPRGFIKDYQAIVEKIRKHSRAMLVLGGSGFTILPDPLMALFDADYGIVGDGERLALLLEALEENKEVSQIPGILSRRRSGMSLEGEPWPAFHRDFDGTDDRIAFYLRQGGILNLQTKRGCPYRCIYCTYPRIDGRRSRLRKPDEVAGEARRLQEAGAKYLFITDSTFNSDQSHSIAVAKAFIKAKLTVPWGAFFAPFASSPDDYRIMADAGLTHVEFGTDSLSDRVLAAYRKPFRTGDVLIAHERACRAGLHIAHYLLLGGPGEDEKTLAETFLNAGRLEKGVFFFFCGIRIYPGTELYDIARAEGQLVSGENLLEPVFYRSRSLEGMDLIRCVEDHARERPNWVIGSGGAKIRHTVARLYAKGYAGPLWEQLSP
jgi:radical SAM superfamily enzyme YgiQ (UPF0313 family)